jgi:hypothetical protein
MKISKIHQNFADRQLYYQRALENPEEYLGPNWKDVLNFWIYLDTLSFEQFETVRMLYLKLNGYYEWRLARNTAREVTSESITQSVYASALTSGPAGAARATLELIETHADVLAGGECAARATFELIGAHKLLDQGKELKIVQLFLDSFKTDP